MEFRKGPRATEWLVTHAGALREFRGKAMDREAVDTVGKTATDLLLSLELCVCVCVCLCAGLG